MSNMLIKNIIDIESDYEDYINKKNEENFKERYQGKEGYYHISGVRFCSRKLYYESVEQVERTNLPDQRGNRIMRLGTVVHNDLQEALSYIYMHTDSMHIDYMQTSVCKTNEKESKQRKRIVDIEGEVIIPHLNIRGFYDLVVHNTGGDQEGVYLFDFKTIGSYPYKLKFGRNSVQDNDHHELQVASYGLGVKEKYGRLDGMWLCYYNKDNSHLKYKNVPMNYLDTAKKYWIGLNEEHKKGLPDFKLGSSPVKEWACDYCAYRNHCGSPFGNKNKKRGGIK